MNYVHEKNALQLDYVKIKVTIDISEETFLVKIHSLFLYLFLISNLEFDLGWEALRPVFVVNFFVFFCMRISM